MTITPESLAAPNTEHAHQTALFCWASSYISEYPELEWMFAIPNGGERNIAVAGRLRAEGVKSGISDVMLPCSRHNYHGLFIEMKKPGALKTESAKQKAFGKYLTDNNYLYGCFDHWEKARDAIMWYLGIQNER